MNENVEIKKRRAVENSPLRGSLRWMMKKRSLIVEMLNLDAIIQSISDNPCSRIDDTRLTFVSKLVLFFRCFWSDARIIEKEETESTSHSSATSKHASSDPKSLSNKISRKKLANPREVPTQENNQNDCRNVFKSRKLG